MVNGYPGVGKTLFAEYSDSILKEKIKDCRILRTSVVDPVKDICLDIGWNGIKDAAGRKFLSDIKDALDSYKEFTFRNLDQWSIMPYDFMFIDARSPYDLDYAHSKHGAITLLIKQDKGEQSYFNHADAEVENYNYDYYLENNGSKKEFYNKVNLFLYKIATK